MTKDFLGLRKVEKNLNKSLSFDIFPKERKFSQPNPRYTRQNQPKEIREIKKAKRSTASLIKLAIHKIKNRKIIKLEKETLKLKKKSEDMAHLIKTLEAKKDYELDIQRYEKELEKLKGNFNDESKINMEEK